MIQEAYAVLKGLTGPHQPETVEELLQIRLNIAKEENPFPSGSCPKTINSSDSKLHSYLIKTPDNLNFTLFSTETHISWIIKLPLS